MVQIQILSGKQAGTEFTARKFPILIGRSSAADLMVTEAGVWENHFKIYFLPDGFTLRAQPNALVAINDQVIEESVLRNGDLISIGSLKLRFGLSPVRQRSLVLREVLTWVALVLLCAIQLALIYALLD